MKEKQSVLKAVDFFCGAGGMTCGLRQAGIDVLGGVDCDQSCEETYEYNNPGSKFLCKDITSLTPQDVGATFAIAKRDDNLLFAGCSPCQFWTKLNTDKTQSRKTAYLLKEFQRFIEYFEPGFVVIENVPGLLKKSADSALPAFHEMLRRHKYCFADQVVNARRFGVPQNRKRYLLVARRGDLPVSLPVEDLTIAPILRDFIGVDNGFPRIPAGHRDTTFRMHSSAKLSENNLRRIRVTEIDGGSRSAWKDDPDLQIEAYDGNDDIFRDVYGRMSWDKAAPTITTRFVSLSNGRFGHPEEDRAISLREGATIQTFPKKYYFKAKSQGVIARHIGNAVPPSMAKQIGLHLKKVHSGKI